MSFGPSAQDQTFFIIQCIDSLHVGTVVKIVLEVVLIDRLEGFTRICRLQQMSKPQHFCEPLTKQLVGEASVAILIADFAILNCSGVPFLSAFLSERTDLVSSRNFLNVELSVPKLLQLRLALLADLTISLGCRSIVQYRCHKFCRSQRAKVERAHHRVGTIKLNVVSIVLFAFHHPVAIGVPVDPGELQRSFSLRPKFSKKIIVSRQLPFAVELQNAAHLSICGRLELPLGITERHHRTK